jgi:hypothetical protein
MCAVVQVGEARHRCGYVRVPPNHPAYKQNYDDVAVDVHGGLTFSDLEPCTEHPDGQGWWLGFDCVHAGDAMYDPNPPADISEETKRFIAMHQKVFQAVFRSDHYWTQEEVERETERLAEQLAAMKRLGSPELAP